MSVHRTVSRLAVVGSAVSAAVVLLAASAHAQVSTFVGSSITGCDFVDPRVGVVTGTMTCDTTGTSAVCITSVDVAEGRVAANCTGNLAVTTNLVYVQHRETSQSAPTVVCTGTGNGIFAHKATPSSLTIDVPVTVTVHGQTAEFGGVALLGVRTAVVTGTYTAACGGFGTYAGQVG